MELALRGVGSDLHKAASRALFRKQIEEVERQLTKSLGTFFSRQIRSVVAELKSLEKSATDPSAEALVQQVFNPREWDNQLIDVTLPILANGMSEAAVGFLLMLGVDPRKETNVRYKSTASEWLNSNDQDLPPGLAAELPAWMKTMIKGLLNESFSQKYWQSINTTTAKRIENLVSKGLSEGWSINRIAAEINDRFPRMYSIARAKNVARTESGSALNGARDASFTHVQQELGELGATIQKSWLSVLGNTTRDAHADLDGTLADADGLFNLNGVMIPWPSHFSLPPSDRCNCQCTLTTEFGVGVDLDLVQSLLS